MSRSPHHSPAPRPAARPASGRAARLCLLWLSTLLPAGLGAAEADPPPKSSTVQQWFLEGRYDDCIEAARQGIEASTYEVAWHLLLTRSLMVTGQYTNALERISRAVDLFRTSIQVRLLAHHVYLRNGRGDRARDMLVDINYLANNRIWAYRDAPNLVALGRAALEMDADPRRVLEQFFDRAKADDPEQREVYLAMGGLALDKGDFQLAAQAFAEGLELHPNDPDLHWGLARAFAPSNRRQMLDSVESALAVNPNHVPSHLLLAEHLIDAEDYPAARESLEEALRVDPWHPEAWALRAVVAHVKADPEAEEVHREKALKFWTNNPAVDHLIGRKLSQKYRFREGAGYQRQALRFDPDYLPARIQLAQDLLRLGREEEGWHLAQAVHENDGYDVTAFNLVNLKEVMEDFATLTNEHFILRLSPHEAALYGRRALDLLERAHQALTRKYQVDLDQPTTVEIFPEQKDFGVRTFGMPDNPGFLGVCFGPVITANSPASQGLSPHNWEAVLWHEFCHVITLHMTRNKMPRWLSEGISVYEELQANPSWGQIMNPSYRKFVLEGELTPVGELSAAFLAPPSELHLQFAYYQSYLVVDFIVRRHGMDQLRRILHDLGEGVEINEAIARHTAPLEEIEPAFEAFAIQRAEALGPGLTWEEPEPEELAEADPDWVELHRNNYHVLRHEAARLLREEKWEEAKTPLRHLLELYPDQRGEESPYRMLALAHRKLGELDQERDVLTRFALTDADALSTYLRLMELERERENWSGVLQNAERFLAVNPLLPAPYTHMARAANETGQTDLAIKAYRNLLRLDPDNPVTVHYQLARLLHETGQPGARRHVLMALEEAPRFRDAHRLLLRIVQPPVPAGHPTDKPETKGGQEAGSDPPVPSPAPKTD